MMIAYIFPLRNLKALSKEWQFMAITPFYFTMGAFVTSSIWPRGKKREAFIWVLVRETEQMPIPTM